MLGGSKTDYTNIRPAYTGPNQEDHRGQLWYKVFRNVDSKINNDSLIIRSNFYGFGTSYRRSFSDFVIDNIRNKTN